MKTMHMGGVLLATAAIAIVGLNRPAQSGSKPASSATQKNVKNVLLTVEGMH